MSLYNEQKHRQKTVDLTVRQNKKQIETMSMGYAYNTQYINSNRYKYKDIGYSSSN